MGPPASSEIKELVPESFMLFSTQLQGNTQGARISGENSYCPGQLSSPLSSFMAFPLYTVHGTLVPPKRRPSLLLGFSSKSVAQPRAEGRSSPLEGTDSPHWGVMLSDSFYRHTLRL